MRPIRRSQLISPFGIGAIVDFPNDESLMTCGLDVWPSATAPCPTEFLVIEERLQRRLKIAHFRLPPDFREPAPGVRLPNMRMPFVNFPRWHYCPRCGGMEQLGLYGSLQKCNGPSFEGGLSCSSLQQYKRPTLLPVRFVAVCPASAHIQDFPFLEWVHRDPSTHTASCTLRLRAGRSAASLSGVTISCKCGQSQTMANAFSEHALASINVRCCGHRPWLGEIMGTTDQCGGELNVVQRGASNVYFSHTASSIYLPLWAERARRPVIDVLETPGIWEHLKNGLVDGKIDMGRCESICVAKKLPGLNANELQEVAQKRLDGDADWDEKGEQPQIDDKVVEEEHFRQAEYDALREGRGEVKSDLYTTALLPQAYGDPISSFFSRITLVHKLRETRAFYGFSRYYPDDNRNFMKKIDDLKVTQSINWLPAIIVRGEGIFFEIDEERIAEWMQHSTVRQRTQGLKDSYNQVRTQRGQSHRNITPKFVLLHTLAHILMNQLSYDCGYGSSSLRERIYCDAELPGHPMNGFLIYTASGDAEGTMGGLVRQGKPSRIEATLIRALRKSVWCSYDPVCMESVGQGPDSCNLAACHGCAILPETSCEEGNRLLDRAMLVGSLDRPEMGLFGSYVQDNFGKLKVSE
jgi:hypothetical protein